MDPNLPVRPAALTRLCILSFINQGIMLPLYVLGFIAAPYMRDADPQEVRHAAESVYQGDPSAEQMDQLLAFLDILREHGVALMAVFALRTAVRLIGTLRMWKLRGDGFHIYTSAQLLGVLVPMLIAGTSMFSLFGLIAVALWCLIYYVNMRAAGALGGEVG